MEFETDLQKLRWAAPPPGLRTRVLREAREGVRARSVAPWFAALERHWLYPGRVPAMALVLVWLVIVSFRFTTPASLLPGVGSYSHLSEDDLVRIEFQRAQLFAELRRDEADFSSPPSTNLLPPRS
jgi:hypothetical protein